MAELCVLFGTVAGYTNVSSLRSMSIVDLTRPYVLVESRAQN